MEWLKIVWIVFTSILLAFPVGFLLYLLYAWLKKVFFLMKKKFENIKALEKMKDDLLKQSAGEYTVNLEQDNSNASSDANNIMESDLSADGACSQNFNENIQKEEVSREESHDKKELSQGVNIKELKNNGTHAFDSIHAEQEKKKLEEKNRQEVNKIIYQAESLKNDGKIDEYEKKIIEGLSLDPHNLLLNRKLADLYFSRQEHKKSLSLLKKIIEQDPVDHGSLRQIGEIYLTNKDYQTAELLIDKAIDLNTENPKYYMSMVDVYYSTDRHLEAVQIMEKVIKLRPDNPKYLQILAEIYDELGDEDNAVKYYFRLLENDPSNLQAKKRLNQ